MKSKNLRKHKDEFKKLYKEGMSLRAIAEMYDISKSSVKRYIEEDMEIRVRGLSDNQKLMADKLYLEGLSVNSIAKDVAGNFSTVKRYLSDKHGQVTHGERKYANLTLGFEKDYKSGMSLTEISEKYNVSRQLISDYIREKGVKHRTYSETSREYQLDEEFFDILDKNKAYILGMFFARGSINKHPSTYFTDVKVYKDKIKILDFITENLYEGKKPVYQKVDDTYVIRISSSHLCKKLSKYGIRNILDENNEDIALSEDILKFKNDFFEGYLKCNARLSTRTFSIANIAPKHKLFIRDYLINDLGISSLRVASNGGGFIVEKKDDVDKILQRHKSVSEKLEAYISTLNSETPHAWSRYM